MHPDRLYALDPVTLSLSTRALPREAVQVARLFDGRRRLWEVVRDSALPGSTTLSVAGRLAVLGIIGEARLLALDAEERHFPKPGQKSDASLEPMPKAASPAEVAVCEQREPSPVPAPAQQGVLAITQRLPRMVVTVQAELAETEAATLLMGASALRAALPSAAAPPSPAASEDPAPAAPESPERAPMAAALPVAFDEADERFFESYRPEDGQVDTFWDLEENPARRLRARRRAQRLAQGGWFRQVFSLF